MTKLEVMPAPVDPFFSKLLRNIHDGKTSRSYSGGESIFAQGAASDAVWFIESGEVMISVVSPSGKEAVLAVLGPRRFFGENALGSETVRQNTATALVPSALFRVTKSSMEQALQSEYGLAKSFMTGLLSRNNEVEEDLCSQLFDPSEKRLARVLLKLARSRENEFFPGGSAPLFNHEVLAEMVGTTRSRITHFLNQFRKKGLIDYDRTGIVVRPKLLGNLVNE